MVAFILCSGMFVGMMVGVTMFITWALNEHKLANILRRQVALQKLIDKQPKPKPEVLSANQWKVRWRNKKKVEFVIVGGVTESLAIKEALLKGVNSKTILSVTRCGS